MQGGIRKKGDSWYYYFEQGKVDGKRNKIERKGGKTKKEATAALKEALEEFKNMGSVEVKMEYTLSEYYDYWYKEYVEINCKHSTQERYESMIRIHIKPALGQYHLNKITPLILQNFLNQKAKEGFSKNTLANFYGALSCAFKMARYPYEFIKVNPMVNVTMPKFDVTKNDKEDLKIITVSQFNQILDRFPEDSRYYIPLHLGFGTGMRAAEVCGLTWDCVDLEKSIIKVEKTLVCKNKEWILSTPKTQSSYRKILIGYKLLSILKKQKMEQKICKLMYGDEYFESNYVCTKNNGEIVTTDALKHLSNIVNKQLNIKFNFHSLRHTHATILLERGANYKDIQERLGHSKLATTMDTYAHLTDRLKLDSVKRLEIINSKLK
jgi:ATP-dependent helicase/nuclease subunit A